MDHVPKNAKYAFPKDDGRDFRVCLKCQRDFMSQSKFNRICSSCKETNKSIEDVFTNDSRSNGVICSRATTYLD